MTREDGITYTRQSDFRLFLIFLLVPAIWLVEVYLARGYYYSLISTERGATIASIFVFTFFGSLPFLKKIEPKSINRGPREQNSKFLGRFGILLALAGASIVLYLVPSGRISYASVIRSDDGIGVYAIWGPLMVAGTMLILATTSRTSMKQLAFFAALIIVASLPGGRTIPAVILVFVLLHFLIYAPAIKPLSAKLIARVVIALLVGVWALAALGSLRDAGLESDNWSERSLAQYGYTSSLPGGAAIKANLGIIGESAMVSRVMTPTTIPFQGPTLIFSDLLSFVPGINETFDSHSQAIYGEFGAPTETSRPGGLHSTFYVVGGNVAVAALAFMFSFICRHSVQYARNGSLGWFGFSILFVTAFLIGAYGVGIPTGMLFLGLLIYWTVLIFSGFSRILNKGATKLKE